MWFLKITGPSWICFLSVYIFMICMWIEFPFLHLVVSNIICVQMAYQNLEIVKLFDFLVFIMIHFWTSFHSGACDFCSQESFGFCSHSDSVSQDDIAWWEGIWRGRGFQRFVETCYACSWIHKKLSTQHDKISAKLLLIHTRGFKK